MDVRFIHRSIGPLVSRMLKESPSLLLTGPRQSGKSTLLRHLLSETHEYFTLDDPRIRLEATQDPLRFLSRNNGYLIIDEVQYAPELFTFLKILIDRDRSVYGRFVLTGSQQFLLMKNLSESLAGRIRLFELLPFSISEKKPFLSFLSSVSAFEQSALRGSYPEILLNENFTPSSWYSGYLQTYVERDVRDLHHVGDVGVFSRFLSLLGSRCSQILNLSSMSTDVGVSVTTLRRWLSILEASRIIYLLPPYYRSQGKRVRKQPKVYFTDIGFLCHLLRVDNRDLLLDGPFRGALFENFCIQETLKVFLERGVTPQLYYLRTSNDLEVDLIIEDRQKLYPIEIKSSFTANSGMTKALDLAIKLFPKLPFQRGKLISLEDSHFSFGKTVDHISLLDYLKWVEKPEQES